MAWSVALDAMFKDPRAGGCAGSSVAGRDGAGLEASFLTTMGAGVLAPTGFLTTVFGATMFDAHRKLISSAPEDAFHLSRA